MTIIRLFCIFALCFFILNVQNVQAQGTKTQAPSKFVPNQLIFRYSPGTTISEVEENLKKIGAKGVIIGSATTLGLFLVKFPPNSLNTNNQCAVIIQGCAGCPTGTGGSSTQGIELNYHTQIGAAFNLQNQSEAWNIKWNPIIEKGENGCPVTVAFLDSGIDQDHLKYTNWFKKTSAAAISDYSSPYDENGHGTHVAGITANIVQKYENINLLSIRTQNQNGLGTIWGMIQAIDIAISKKATIVNMSLAYWPSCDSGGDSMLKTAMQIAGQKYNVLFVTAAGNNGRNLVNNKIELVSDTDKKKPINLAPFYVYPSMYNLPNQINVAALDDKNKLAQESSWGTNYGVNYVNIGTDGVNIHSSTRYGKYTSMSGTSMAAPHVTAVASILASKSCELNFKQLRECILNSATFSKLPLSTTGYLQPSLAINCKKAQGRSDENSEDVFFEDTEENIFKIYPNPFNEALNLEFTSNNLEELIHCTLYNSTGQIVQKIDSQVNINTTLDVQNLPKGVYLLKIQQGEIQKVRKLIKQ